MDTYARLINVEDYDDDYMHWLHVIPWVISFIAFPIPLLLSLLYFLFFKFFDRKYTGLGRIVIFLIEYWVSNMTALIMLLAVSVNAAEFFTVYGEEKA